MIHNMLYMNLKLFAHVNKVCGTTEVIQIWELF
jgi:hypothetical protein